MGTVPNFKMRVWVSSSAAARLAAVQRWVADRPAPLDLVIVAPTRSAADDLARAIAVVRGSTFGVARASVREFVVKLALPALTRQGRTPASGLALEALAARVAAEARDAGELSYLGPMVDRPGFRRTLLTTLTDVRLAALPADALTAAPRTGDDLRVLARRFERALDDAGTADYASVLALAATALDATDDPLDGRAIVLLDVPVHTARERALVAALAGRPAPLLATAAAGDDDTRDAFASLPGVAWEDDPPASTPPALRRIQDRLFEDLGSAPADAEAAAGASQAPPVEFFSAPGEGREAVEIARRILREAAAGRRFDAMAIAVRSPALYAAHLEAALHRAGIPVWFSRGTSRPDPSGRAFLAILACAAEGLAARRFAEYASLGQIPREVPAQAPAWQPPAEDPLDGADGPGSPVTQPLAALSPWRWEALLNEAAVIGGLDRWTRRLAGLDAELRLRAEAIAVEDPDAPRGRALERDRTALAGLRAFALPILATLAEWPARDTWGAWLDRLDQLAPRVLASPGRVMATLANLRPMAALGPVGLAEVRDVLDDRLRELHVDPPPQRYGRVFVGTPDALRGRAFDVVFVPGLAERLFPQRSRPDPLLLDSTRAHLARGVRDGRQSLRQLPYDVHRTHDERLRLRVAVGAASARLYASYPSMEIASARARVPSFYALDLHRAGTGRLPDHDSLAVRAADASGARLAWPAPPDPMTSIDPAEHDLATLRRWLLEPSRDRARGRARYLLDLSPILSRSLRARYARSRRKWTAQDGLAREPFVRAALAAHRLRARPFSPSALQRFATCPYQFYLASILRLAPREEPRAMHRLDPLTRGQLVHEILAGCTRELLARQAWPTRLDLLPAAADVLSQVVARVEARYRDDLAPAIDSVWRDEIAAIHADLRGWLHAVATSGDRWTPMLVEFGIGFGPGDGARDAASVTAPAILPDGWQVHGIVDVIEQDATTGALRVTDYKTGRDSVRGRYVVGGGQVLQPALYGLAVEAALDRAVDHARLFFSTAKGRYTSRPLTLTPDTDGARRAAVEVLEIVDRAIDLGFLPPAPRPDACAFCDFRVVCGPLEERRVRDKDPDPLTDLQALRGMK